MLRWVLLFTLIGDSDLLDQKQIKEIIESTLKDIDLYSSDAVSLIYNTGLVESKYMYLKQIKGPAKGLFQCESWVAVDICKNYLKYRESLMKKVAKACKLEWYYFLEPKEEDWEHILTTNVAAQIAMCRLHYRRVPKPLPKTIEEQASQWKTYYNSSKGKGTVEKFIEIVKKYG